MTDELDDLKAAFDAATPAPDAARKRATIAQAEKISPAPKDRKAGRVRPFRQARWAAC